mgnify:CR=1 FL=1
MFVVILGLLLMGVIEIAVMVSLPMLVAVVYTGLFTSVAAYFSWSAGVAALVVGVALALRRRRPLRTT